MHSLAVTTSMAAPKLWELISKLLGETEHTGTQPNEETKSTLVERLHRIVCMSVLSENQILIRLHTANNHHH